MERIFLNISDYLVGKQFAGLGVAETQIGVSGYAVVQFALAIDFGYQLTGLIREFDLFGIPTGGPGFILANFDGVHMVI